MFFFCWRLLHGILIEGQNGTKVHLIHDTLSYSYLCLFWRTQSGQLLVDPWVLVFVIKWGHKLYVKAIAYHSRQYFMWIINFLLILIQVKKLEIIDIWSFYLKNWTMFNLIKTLKRCTGNILWQTSNELVNLQGHHYHLLSQTRGFSNLTTY